VRAVSLAYWTLIAVTCPVFFVGALIVFALTAPFDRRRVALHLYSSAWATFYVRVNPLWTVHVEGRERLPRHGAAVLVANHASLIDILVLFDLFRPYKWVSKASNFKLPFVGWNMRLNDYVPLLRGDRESVLAMLDHCARHLDAGSPILMFPEGTRSPDGALKAFKDGAFDLAVAHGVPVIPIAVLGTAEALPKHGLVLEQHVDARIVVLEPIAPGNDAAALRDTARERIAAALAAS
jgi:1-acyl-sn-glycerol-3-phosphate acyltransferase